MIKRVFGHLKDYLTDWKNLLGHALIGVGFVAAAIWVPIKWPIKTVIILILIAFNIWRMRRGKEQEEG